MSCFATCSEQGHTEYFQKSPETIARQAQAMAQENEGGLAVLQKTAELERLTKPGGGGGWGRDKAKRSTQTADA